MIFMDLRGFQQGIESFFDGCKDGLIDSEKFLEKQIIKNFFSSNKKYEIASKSIKVKEKILEEAKNTKGTLTGIKENFDNAMSGQCSMEIEKFIENKSDKYNTL